MEQDFTSLQQVEEIKPEGFSPLFTKVQRIYIGQFREWFAITAPTSVFATVVLVATGQVISAFYRQTPRWESSYFAEVAKMAGLKLGSYFFAWFLGCFALAAIATVVSRLDGEEEGAPLRDSHHRAREHLGAIFKAAVATFIAMVIGMAILEIGLAVIIKIVGYRHISNLTLYVLDLTGTVIVSGILSRFGMVIPLVVRGDMGVWTALNESLKIGERHKGFLYLLVIQSVVGSYVGWYAVHYMLLLVPDSIRFTGWYRWGALIVSALASAAVSPPMFIGFSVLAEEKTSAVEMGA